MQDVVLIAIVLVAVVAVVFAVVRFANQRQARLREAQRWHLEEHAESGYNGSFIDVYCVRPGERLLIGRLQFEDPDFESKVELLRSQGRMRLVALNSGLRQGLEQ